MLAAPDQTHWFGTDEFGRDVLSRVLWGARISLYVGFAATLLGVVGASSSVWSRATTAGSSTGSPWRRLTFCCPSRQLIMGLMLVAVLGATLVNLIIAIAVTTAPAFVRIARGSTLAMRERDFVDACRALGFSTRASCSCMSCPTSSTRSL